MTDLLHGKGIRLYNLFPRLVGSMTLWKEHLPHIAGLGFNAVWVNPFHYPGFSASLYSPKDYYKFNPVFIDDRSRLSPTEQLLEVIAACHSKGLLFIMDLVINHTAIDCTLIAEHESWFKKQDGKIVHPGAWDNGKWMEWGDLAEVDNAGSPDRENLWQFWWRMMSHYLELGVDGFRCDAAYQVPDDLWRFLIEKSRQKKPGCLFLAESLGCSTQQVEQLAGVGFDYLFNSSKYWDFNQPWGLEQYEKTKHLVGTISFPESHDTDRLTQEVGGDIAAVKRQIAFSTIFSKGVMMPIGLEYGFRRRMNVVNTDPGWWEKTQTDLSEFIQKMLTIKASAPTLNQEAGLEITHQDNWFNIFCCKRSAPGQKPFFLAMNKDRFQYQRLYLPDLERVLGPGAWKDVSPEYPMDVVPRAFEYYLRPAQVKILTTI